VYYQAIAADPATALDGRRRIGLERLERDVGRGYRQPGVPDGGREAVGIGLLPWKASSAPSEPARAASSRGADSESSRSRTV